MFRPVQNSQRKLKIAPAPDDDIMQFVTAAGNYCAKANNVEGRSVIEASGSKIRCNNEDIELKTANGDDLDGCVDLSTDLPVKSGLLQKFDDEIMESGPGDQSKDGTPDVYVSLNIKKAERARQSISSLVLENYQATGSKQDDTVLDFAMEFQSLQARTPVKQQDGPKESRSDDSISKVLLTAANVSDTLLASEYGNYLPAVLLSGNQYLTSQVHARNASPCFENLSKEGIPVPTNILPLNDVIPVVSTGIPNIGNMRSLECKKYTAKKENGPSSPTHKFNKIGDNESHVTPDVSTLREGSALPGKDLQKYETLITCNKLVTKAHQLQNDCQWKFSIHSL